MKNIFLPNSYPLLIAFSLLFLFPNMNAELSVSDDFSAHLRKLIFFFDSGLCAQNIRADRPFSPRSVRYPVNLTPPRAEKFRTEGRTKEEDDRRLIEKGREDLILRQDLIENYQVYGLPKIDNIYYETLAERGFIIYFISFPIVTLYTLLAIQGLKFLAGQGNSGYTNEEVGLALIAGTAAASGITAFDYHRIQEKQKQSKSSLKDVQQTKKYTATLENHYPSYFERKTIVAEARLTFHSVFHF